MNLETMLLPIARDVLTSAPDAKPLAKSRYLWSAVFGAVAWTTHNLALWFSLDQSTEATLFWGALGTIWFTCTLVIILRSKGIRVPKWVAVIAEAVLEGAPKP